MRSLSSTNEMLLSLPIEVHFAGFRTTTTAMGRSGWDLSLEQNVDMLLYEKEFRLAARHGDRESALYLLSHPLRLRRSDHARYTSSPVEYAKFFAEQHFEIAYASNNISVRCMNHGSFSANFRGFDPYPQERTETEENIRDLPFFKVAKEQPKELIVDPSRVPELLDLILKSQEQQQAEIRERNRRRERIAHYDGEIKSAGNVCAQIITLAG